LEQDYSTGKKPIKPTDHHAIAGALSVMEELDDPGLHIRMDHHAVVVALGRKE
jgi:hypothetical protein